LNKFRLSALAAAVALVVAGCGGGGDNKTLSYSDFSKQANQICKDSNAEVKPLSAKLNGDPKNDTPILAQVVPKIEAAATKFKALKPPTELKADFDKFISITDQQLASTKKAQASAKAGDQAAYVAELKSQKPLAQQNDLVASKLGAADCTK
jgi:hypothetical protein